MNLINQGILLAAGKLFQMRFHFLPENTSSLIDCEISESKSFHRKESYKPHATGYELA